MVRLSFTALATVGIAFVSRASAVSTISSSGFVSSDGGVGFALNIPQKDENEDLYMTLYGPVSSSWIAVGMGSEEMKDSLMFIVYTGASNEITLSPRLSYGNVEPSFTNITVKTLPGTGIANGKYNVNFMCRKCRSWAGGSIDATSTTQKFIFATGPNGDLRTDDLNAPTKRHSVYGTFTMDMTKAVGASSVPVAQNADTAGTVQGESKSDRDFSSPFHGCLMILVFVGLMPIGVMILRIMNSPKWHGVNQTVSAGIALLGAGLGVYSGRMYNRTKNYNSAHQILGTVVIVGMVAQFVLGFLHHRMYKKTQATTKLAPIHVWLGRIIIPAGIATGFLGFPLALNSKYNYALLALVLLVIVVMGPFAFWRWRRDAQKNKTRNGAAGMDLGGGYQAQPWATGGPSQSDINLPQYGGHSASGQNHPPVYLHPDAGRNHA